MNEKFDWTKLPRVFVDDSLERFIFEPKDDRWATRDELMSLRRDAEFYTDRWGPDECPRGLKASARAVLKRLDKMGVK